MKQLEILEQQYKKLRKMIDKERDKKNINEIKLNFLLEEYKILCMDIAEELMINNADVLKRLKECKK